MLLQASRVPQTCLRSRQSRHMPTLRHSNLSRIRTMRVQAWGSGHTLAEAVHGDTWALNARAAMLDLKVEELNAYIYSSVDNAWLAVCDPERLFALKELCKLLGADIGTALELVQQQPSLLDTPSRTLEAHVRGIQSLLELPRPELLQLLYTAPSLLVLGPNAIEQQVQRAAWGLGLSAAAPEAVGLMRVLPALGTDALLDHHVAEQKLAPLISKLSLAPGDALMLLQSEMAAGHDLQAVLDPANLDSLSRQWRALADEVKVPIAELMAALAAQLITSDSRYTIGSAELLRADIVALQAASQLNHATACRMLLAAPRLAKFPASFWQLLMQYILFLVPQWREQLQKMPPADAGLLLARLFDCTGADVDDSVSVSHNEALFATADIDYNQELAVLEALLDQGMTAPKFAAPGRVRAGRLWRLVYMCNPRLAAAQQAKTVSTTSAWVGPWSRMFNLQLPGPLLNQMQQQGALSCDLSEAPTAARAGARSSIPLSSNSNAGRSSAAVSERIEGLSEVVLADVVEFCDWHPGYAHWLHNTAFELEWAHSKAAVDVATWDPVGYGEAW